MADANVPITAGAGTNIDTRTAPDGDHRQVIVLGDPLTNEVVTVLPDGAGEFGLAVSQVATGFVFSTVNSSTAQLAAGATFNGQAETVINQQAVSLLFIADQACRVEVRQWIGVSGTTGTGQVSSFTYTALAGQGISRAFVANGNYISVHVTNLGSAATTTLNLNVAYGTLPAQTGLGNSPSSINEVSGYALAGDPVGAVPVSEPPTTAFYEDFAGALDTANKWTPVNPAAWTITGGSATYPTTAVATSITTIPTVSVGSNQYYIAAFNVRLEAVAATGTGRYWGFGTAATTPGIQSLAQEGVGFQVDTTGALQAVSYTGGAKTALATLARPFDNAVHRYQVIFRGALTIWTLDGVEVWRQTNVNVATQSLSGHLSYFATGSTIVGTPQTVVQAFGIGDRSRLHTYVADPQFPWRRSRVTPSGELYITDSNRIKQSVGIVSSGRLTVGAAADAATGGRLWLVNPIGSAVLLEVRRIEFSSAPTTATAFPTSPRFTVERMTFTGAPTGAAITPAVRDTADPALIGTVRTVSTGMTITAGAAAYAFTVAPILTAVGAAVPVLLEWEPMENGRLVLRPGQGIVIRQADAGTTADNRAVQFQMGWAEYTVMT